MRCTATNAHTLTEVAASPDVCYCQVRTNKDTSVPKGLDKEADYCGKDQYRQHVWRLRQPRIIRRAIAHPSAANQGFYFQPAAAVRAVQGRGSSGAR